MVYARNVSVLCSRGIKEISGVFCTSPYPIEAKVRFSLDLIMHFITITNLEAMSWDQFLARFRERFLLGPQHVSAEDSAKNPKIFDSRDKGLQGRGRSAKCGRSHKGSCREKRVGCFSCHQIDHFSRECLKGLRLIFFHYNQVCHNKIDYLGLTDRVASASAPITLRITNGHEGGIEASTEGSRVF